MDTSQQQPGQPPMNGDDDLAKVLHEGLQFEETPRPGDDAASDGATAPTLTAAPDDLPAVHHDHDKSATSTTPSAAPAEPTVTIPSLASPAMGPTSTGNAELDQLKMSALEELRPLVGKLDLPPEDKFDTLLLIIRSTDDQALLTEAHEAAKNITDEKRRAQALLDVVKEIDYFASKR